MSVPRDDRWTMWRVKARARSGATRLTANEWKKERRHATTYWQYVVTEAATATPRLTCIQNPAACFTLDEDIFATAYVVPEDRWRNLARESRE